MSEEKLKEKLPPTQAELLAAELAKMRLCPGNEAHKFAVRIIDLVEKFQPEDIQGQLNQDDLDIDEVLKNQRTMMESIVILSKMVTAMHDEIKRIKGGDSAKGKRTSIGNKKTNEHTSSGNKETVGS